MNLRETTPFRYSYRIIKRGDENNYKDPEEPYWGKEEPTYTLQQVILDPKGEVYKIAKYSVDLHAMTVAELETIANNIQVAFTQPIVKYSEYSHLTYDNSGLKSMIDVDEWPRVSEDTLITREDGQVVTFSGNTDPFTERLNLSATLGEKTVDFEFSEGTYLGNFRLTAASSEVLVHVIVRGNQWSFAPETINSDGKPINWPVKYEKFTGTGEYNIHLTLPLRTAITWEPAD